MARHQRDPAKEAFWLDVFRRFAASGISVRAFCKRERLAESAFYAWRRTIGDRSGTGNAGPAFVPAIMTTQPRSESSIAIELAGGCVLRFSGANATEQLADLVVTLQSRCRR
jgi:hypothetical protein